MLCVEVGDFSENESSKTNWKHVILHQEHMDCSSGIKKNIFVWLWLLLRLARPFRGAFSARRALHWSNHFPPAVRWQLKPWLLPGGCQGNTHPGCTSPSYQCDTGVWDCEARALANSWWLLTTHLSASLHITWRTTVVQMNPSKTKVMLVKKVKCFKELTLTPTSCHSIAHVSSLSPCWRNLESFSELARQQSLKAPYFISGKLGNSLISSWMRPRWPIEGHRGRPSWPPIWLVGIPCLNLNVKSNSACFPHALGFHQHRRLHWLPGRFQYQRSSPF